MIRKVSSASDIRKFIGYPYKLYKGNQYWCPPIRRDEKDTLVKKKNPAFDFCDAEYWLAYQGKEIVGRIAGIINRAANERWNEKRVRFGWIDFIDDLEVSRMLVDTVMEWGRSKGMDSIHGPLGFSDMDNQGMLIRGFDELANKASVYNYPYYPVHMEKLGFEKAADWIQYIMPTDPIPDKVKRIAKLVGDKYNIRPVKVKKRKDLLPYAGKMWDLLNLTFKDLYGFTALTEKQTAHYTKKYFSFLNPDYVSLLVNDAGDLVGFGISMPSLTKALQKCNGRLFPFGFIYLLRALRKNDLIDLCLNAVHPHYQGKGIVAIYHNELQCGFIRNNITTMVTNPQLDDNTAVLMWKMYNARQHLTRRCWIKHC
jgi:hypothetical protein